MEEEGAESGRTTISIEDPPGDLRNRCGGYSGEGCVSRLDTRGREAAWTAEGQRPGRRLPVDN